MRAGVVDGSWLPRTARAIAHLMSQVTSREAEAMGRELMRLPYSRSSIERVGHAVGAEYLSRREQVEPKLIETCELPPGVASVSVSVDRVTVPMAYCATVTLHDVDGTALHTIRYGRMPAPVASVELLTHREVHRMMDRLREDVLTIRRRLGPIPVVLLADGASEIWRLFSEHLNEKTLGLEPIRLVDAWHALEYIAAAARLLEVREQAWPGTFRRWKAWLLEEAGGAKRVFEALEKSGMRNARDATGNRPVGDALRYFQNRASLLHYAEARFHGLPIGSGAVEATCKSLVSLRMKRCGARWKHTSGNEILQLRALQLSDRWDAAMPRVLSPLRKPVHVITRGEALGRLAANASLRAGIRGWQSAFSKQISIVDLETNAYRNGRIGCAQSRNIQRLRIFRTTPRPVYIILLLRSVRVGAT